MEDSYSENQNLQPESQHIQRLTLDSPAPNFRLDEPIIIDAPLAIESIDDHNTPPNYNHFLASAYQSTFSPQSFTGTQGVDEYIDNTVKFELSIGSYEMIPNSMTIDPETFRQISNSDQIQRATRNYHDETRQDKVQRYQSKKGFRNFSKTLRYPTRKRVADQRERIDGKFQKIVAEPKIGQKPVDMTPKKRRCSVGKMETIANMKTARSMKGKK